MASMISFLVGTAAGSVLALVVYVELVRTRRRERALRAIVHALEERVAQEQERERAEVERLMNTQWLPREVTGEVFA